MKPPTGTKYGRTCFSRHFFLKMTLAAWRAAASSCAKMPPHLAPWPWQTVENFFDLGFLVKDGRVALTADERGAYVVPSKPPLADAYEKGLLKTQNILKLDYATYRQLVARWCGEGAPYLASRGS